MAARAAAAHIFEVHHTAGSKIRVLLHGLPNILDEIVRQALTAEADVVVTVDPDALASIETRPSDFVVLVDGDGEGKWSAEVATSGIFGVVVISADGSRARLYRRALRREVLEDVSPEALGEALRRARAAVDDGPNPDRPIQ
jgi:hypothetical protein